MHLRDKVVEPVSSGVPLKQWLELRQVPRGANILPPHTETYTLSLSPHTCTFMIKPD